MVMGVSRFWRGCGWVVRHWVAQLAPIAALGRDAPSGPEVEATVDVAPIIAQTENQPAILPPLRMLQPPTPEGDPIQVFFIFITDPEAPVEIEIAQGLEGQECRHEIDIALAPGFVLGFLEAPHHPLAAIEHDALVAVKLIQ